MDFPPTRPPELLAPVNPHGRRMVWSCPHVWWHVKAEHHENARMAALFFFWFRQPILQRSAGPIRLFFFFSCFPHPIWEIWRGLEKERWAPPNNCRRAPWRFCSQRELTASRNPWRCALFFMLFFCGLAEVTTSMRAKLTSCGARMDLSARVGNRESEAWRNQGLRASGRKRACLNQNPESLLLSGRPRRGKLHPLNSPSIVRHRPNN